MTILFDIKHVAHINFFNVVIARLVEENHEVLISYIERGKLPKIIKKEFPGISSYSIGRHQGTTFSILYEANVLKFFKARKLIKHKNIDIMLGVDAFVTGLACKISSIPNIQFYDDPERKVNLKLEQLTSDALFYPEITDFSGTTVQTYRALKEWAYLSPAYFEPNEDSLKEWGVKAGNYIFVREVDTGSLNYKDQKAGVVASVADQFPAGKKVLLSLENKDTIDEYPPDWILLQEPLQDIHSLMYYASAVVSSGDSMAREGAMLGVPSFYIGFRDMAANRFIQKEGLFFVIPPELFGEKMSNLESLCKDQEVYRQRLFEQWIDVSELIYNQLFATIKSKQ
tara:strand:- start:3956 stop:4978 length:1023 start_codon:yes stop_codon:yes gene_type:complete